ncbi:deoxyribodipyrimidine photo-lyase [Ceratobasidium sp. AG-Ba]|nr:deoxyribodipyrimidine photo-lyase [Ceratobasidium sp. AG-Ba]
MTAKRTRRGTVASSSNKKQRTLDSLVKKETTPNDPVPAAEPAGTTNTDDEPAYIQQVHGKSRPLKTQLGSMPILHWADSKMPYPNIKTTSRTQPRETVSYIGCEWKTCVDNRALSAASSVAKELGVPLLVLFVLSPDDYVSHDRSPRRIDFCLRNLALLKDEFNQLNIPLYTTTHTPRKTLPDEVINIVRKWGATRLYAISNTRWMNCGGTSGSFPSHTGKHSRRFLLGQVYSPWWKNWVATLAQDSSRLEESPPPAANNKSVRTHPKFSDLFESEVPGSVEGFECHDRDRMIELWPAGGEAAQQRLDRFLRSKARDSQLADSDALSDGEEQDIKHSGIKEYMTNRDHADADTTSRISPYLSSGVISARACIRGAMEAAGVKRIDVNKTTGPMVWISEVAWRDFYTHVMAAFPRVSMGRPFHEKYADVKWETDPAHLKAWKEGKTGVPIVDAAMRQANSQGWMHNRARMIVAMYFTKDLMLDWRLGERYFMQQLIDGDLASNNGGWQWSASTGTDPQPYFRIFNPYSQSEKADPSGNYIRRFVPELKGLEGKALHDPFSHIDKATFKKLGYPEPLVAHKEARERALRRYKNPGEE